MRILTKMGHRCDPLKFIRYIRTHATGFSPLLKNPRGRTTWWPQRDLTQIPTPFENTAFEVAKTVCFVPLLHILTTEDERFFYQGT